MFHSALNISEHSITYELLLKMSTLRVFKLIENNGITESFFTENAKVSILLGPTICYCFLILSLLGSCIVDLMLSLRSFFFRNSLIDFFPSFAYFGIGTIACWIGCVGKGKKKVVWVWVQMRFLWRGPKGVVGGRDQDNESQVVFRRSGRGENWLRTWLASRLHFLGGLSTGQSTSGHPEQRPLWSTLSILHHFTKPTPTLPFQTNRIPKTHLLLSINGNIAPFSILTDSRITSDYGTGKDCVASLPQGRTLLTSTCISRREKMLKKIFTKTNKPPYKLFM